MCWSSPIPPIVGCSSATGVLLGPCAMTKRASFLAVLSLLAGSGCAISGFGGFDSTPTHTAPSAVDPQATIELRSGYETTLGPKFNEHFQVDGHRVARSRAEQQSGQASTQVAPGFHTLTVGTAFFHTELDSQRKIGTDERYLVERTVDHGGCSAQVQVRVRAGASYRLTYVFQDIGRCTLECRRRVPTPTIGDEEYTAPCDDRP